MFPYRKVILSLLAPLGASTIVGTGFSVWVFSESFGDEVTLEADLDQVRVTPEITNGNLTINTVPDMVVFSEGMQGKNDLFDGINFYSNEEIDSGTKIIATFDDPTTHQMSLLYEKSFTDNSERLYFSMSETGSGGSLTLWTSKLTKQNSSVEGFYTTWIGSTVEQKENVTIVLNNGGNNDGSGTVSINNGTPLSFTFKTKPDENKPSITITNSEFSFRYTYDNPLFIDESETGYKLNIGLKFDLSSKEHHFSNITEIGDTLSLSNTEINASISRQEDGSYLYKDGTFSGTLTFTSDESSQDSNLSFNSGTYEGVDDTKKIPITLIISNNGDAKNATLKIGSMDRFLCLVDALTSSSNPLLETQGEYEDYLFITNDENYASTNLHIDIEKHLDEKSPYIDYTCQLDEYIRYLNSEVKPYDFNKYLSLIESYNIGEWNFRITLVAFYTQESQEVGA